jgi:uncharacterized delta-60 repeat protein
MKFQTDGKLLMGGNISHVNSSKVNNLVRLNTDYSVDETFLFNGIKDLMIKNIEIQSNGDIILFAQKYIKDIYDFGFYIFRLGPDGRIKNGIDTLVNISSITIQDDNKVIVGGGGPDGGYLYRFNSDLSADKGFKKNSFNNQVRSVGYFGNCVYAGGPFTKVNGSTKNNMARFNQDGNVDNIFDIGTGTSDNIGSLTFQDDGKILIGQTLINEFNGVLYQGLIRLNTDGSVDSNFKSPKFYGMTSDVLVSGSSIYLAGPYVLNSSDTYLIRLNSDGTVDNGFSRFLLDEFGFVDFSMVKKNNKLIFNNSTTRGNIYGLVSTDLNGALINGFAPETGRFGTLVLSDYIKDRLVIAGDFIKINDVYTFGVAKLNKCGEVDKSYLLKKNLGTVKQVKILSNNSLLINTQKNFFRLTKYADIDPQFNFIPFKNLYEILKFTVINDGKIVVSNGNKVYRLNSNGTEDPSLDTGTGMGGTFSGVFDFDFQGSKIIFGSVFDNFNGTPANKLVRLNNDGSIDNTFDIGTGPDNDVSFIKVLKSGEMIIGGFFNHFNGFETPNRIVKLRKDGAVDPDFLNKQKNVYFVHGIDLIGADAEVADTVVYVKGDVYVSTFNINGTIYNDFNIPGEVHQVNDIVTESDTTMVGGKKKSMAADIVESYMYALGSFGQTSSDPVPIIKLYLGENSASVLNVSQNIIHLTGSAGSHSTFQITSDEPWVINCDQTWLSLDVVAGKGNATLNVSSLSTNNDNQRTATLTVTGRDGKTGTITVTQANITTDINDVTEPQILIYPLPVKDKLNIVLKGNLSEATCSVISCTGQTLYTTKIKGNFAELDMSSYSRGLYFIRINGYDQKVIMKKILKQ